MISDFHYSETMTHQQLSAFLLVADMRSLSRAAIASDTAQSLLSRHIAMLEAGWGRRLFDWAAAGSVDTDLSFLSFLELYGTEIAERRMPARRVVEALDVVEHI